MPVISIDEEDEPEVQVMARPHVARVAVEGVKEKPIDVELLADVDVSVKMEEEDEEEAQPLVKKQKKEKKKEEA